MKKETPQEASFRELLPPALRSIAQVDMSYSHYFRVANQNLHELYGSRADLNKCIEWYRSSREYQESCHIALRCEDILLLSKDTIFQMIHEDEDYLSRVNQFLKFTSESETPPTRRSRSDPSRTIQAAKMLGIFPTREPDALYHWIIDRRDLTDSEKKQFEEKIVQNINILEVLVNVLSKTFEPGLLLTFPNVGTVMTQQKSQFYYRGESAYYGSSKPGLYREHGKKAPDDMAHFVGWIKINEACSFLDKFDAVRQWSGSAVNYIALVQHYGIPTMMMDVTSDLKTALFFACCKYGKDRKWHPLESQDFAEKDSRKHIADLGGDSRYGILYRSPMELTDFKWALADDTAGMNIITPVGYQPFMRCSSQHGYMLLVNSPKYDMLKDASFSKYRFRLNADLCQWIYEEMDCGDKIYPHKDVPDMEQHMEMIKNSRQVSKQAFDLVMEKYRLTNAQKEMCKRELTKYGCTVVDGEIEHITANWLRKINKKYGIEEAVKRTNEQPKLSPMLQFVANTSVKKGADGDYELGGQ